MTSPIERYRAREVKAQPDALRDGPPPEPISSALVTKEEARAAAANLGLPLSEATAIVLHPPGEKPWPYRYFSREQVREIGAIVSEWLKVKLATIQTDQVDELIEKNRALTEMVAQLNRRLDAIEKRAK